MKAFLARILGANWSTSVTGVGGVVMAFIAWLATLSYDQGGIALIVPIEYKPWVTKIAALAGLILLAWNAVLQKSWNTTGGTKQQTDTGAIAAPGTQSSSVNQTAAALPTK